MKLFEKNIIKDQNLLKENSKLSKIVQNFQKPLKSSKFFKKDQKLLKNFKIFQK